MEGKKISFGFSKTRRAPDTRLAAPVQATPEEERRDYIDCLEEKAIKIVGGELIEEKKPLVIPMKPNTLITAAERLQRIAAEVESSVEQSEAPAAAPEPLKVENETLEQQVERELMEEARNVKKVEPQVMMIQIEKLPPLEGQKEPTLDDYESVPIGDFGLAMLRGMGWTPGKESKYSQPSLRPKGLGLGADKLVKQGAVKSGGGAEEEELKLRKGCHVRVTAGKHSGAYGKVVSMDDESGRALVELAMRRESVSVSEHTLQPVSKHHYDERSRVINSDKYDEYKKKELSEKERNEKNSKKGSHSNAENSSRRPESSKQNTTNGGEKNKAEKSSRNEVESRRHSSSEDDGKERKSRKSPEHSQRSASNGNDRYKRERRSRDRSTSTGRRKRNEPSRSRRSSSSSTDDRKDTKKTRDKSARNRSSSDDRTEQKSRNERKARKSSTSSEDSRTRRKKKSNKQRGRSSGSESLNSVSSDEPRRLKKSKKKKSDGKRDIDKKRKGKKKRRDRDRSPNYRKHKR